MRMLFISASIPLLSLLLPELWRDMFEKLRKSRSWRYIQLVCILWIGTVVYMGVSPSATKWAVDNRALAIILSAIVGAFIFGALARWGIGKLQPPRMEMEASAPPPSTSEPAREKLDLKVSVLGIDYHESKSVLAAHLMFRNNGTTQRTVLSVTFGYRDPDRLWKNSWEFVTPVPGFLGHVQPIRIEPNSEHVETFEVALPERFREKVGGVIGLLFNATTPSGAVKNKEVEVIEISKSPKGGNGIAYIGKRVEGLSIDVDEDSPPANKSPIPKPRSRTAEELAGAPYGIHVRDSKNIKLGGGSIKNTKTGIGIDRSENVHSENPDIDANSNSSQSVSGDQIASIDLLRTEGEKLQRTFALPLGTLPEDEPKRWLEKVRLYVRTQVPQYGSKFEEILKDPRRHTGGGLSPELTSPDMKHWMNDDPRRQQEWPRITAMLRLLDQIREELYSKLP